MRSVDVRYHYGPYSGVVTVYVRDDEDPIAAAWRQLRRTPGGLSLPMAYQSAKVIAVHEMGPDEDEGRERSRAARRAGIR